MPVLAGIVALAIVTAIAIVVTSKGAEAPSGAATATGGTVPAAAASAAHARWSIRAYPAGVQNKRTKGDRARVVAARPHVKALIRDLYDALFVRPDRLRSALSQHATVAAAREIRRSGVGFPPGAEKTLIRKRTARVGIQGNRAGHAVAAVRVVSTGTIGGGRFRLVHNATLWLQRNDDGWKLIGFDFDQRRAR